MEQNAHTTKPPKSREIIFYTTFLRKYLVVWYKVYNFAPETIQVTAANNVYGPRIVSPHHETTETNCGRTFNVCKKTLKCVLWNIG